MIKRAQMRKDNSGAAIRRRLTAAISMLLISTIMMVTTTYAWFTLSTAPEVRGINTSVAGNGSLEIALMPTTGTFAGITSGRDASGTEYGGAQVMTVANVSWGNVVNLKDPSYGLEGITLRPVQFNATLVDTEKVIYQKDESGNIVTNTDGDPVPVYEADGQTPKTEIVKEPDGTIGNVPFSRPAYGYDGRITELKDTVLKSKDTSAKFDSDNYGVRAIVDENGDDTYGYAIDLALRLNTVAADENSTTAGKLLLQTEGAQRVYTDSNAAATQGGGSRLWFQDENGDEVTGADQTLASEYLKVIRLAFIQNFGNAGGLGSERVLAYAKADVNTGYLTLCDYYGNPVADNVILNAMTKNTAYQISVVVWLDGNTVTNANMAINNDVLSKATLNLQFATDVTLVPAQNSDLKNNPPEPVTEAVTEAETDAETVTETEAEQPEPNNEP